MTMAEVTEFVGRGIAFPMSVNHQGGIGLVGGAENIERSIRLIIGTAYGERPMRPEFGCGIHSLVFETATPSIASQAQVHVVASLARWETRADILDVTVSFENETRMLIAVTYRIKGTYDPRNLLVPFYLIPAEAS